MTDGILIRRLTARALNGAEELPEMERAELYQAAGLALRPFDREAADIAFHTAMLLREAQRHQLEFRGLLAASTPKASDSGTNHKFGPAA